MSTPSPDADAPRPPKPPRLRSPYAARSREFFGGASDAMDGERREWATMFGDPELRLHVASNPADAEPAGESSTKASEVPDERPRRRSLFAVFRDAWRAFFQP